MYILKRTTDGRYVADMQKSKTGSSYTPDIRQAKQYATREQADDNRCPENERIVDLHDELEGR